MKFISLFLFISAILLTISLNVYEAANTCEYGAGGSRVAVTVVVDKSGAGNFKTVQAAIDSVPEDNTKWYKIQINAGTYVEQVTIPNKKSCIFLQGQGREVTKITYDAHNATDTSVTFCSISDNVLVKGITFENSYNLGEGGRRNPIFQALSARIYGDKSAFYECGFVGLLDTLWDVQGRHYYNNCYIEGAIDFIFGSGQSLFENCWINATIASLPPKLENARRRRHGYITSQGRLSEKETNGFVFLQGTVSSTGPIFLGRAYGSFSTVIFQDTNLLANVLPLGWDAWLHKGQEGQLTYVEANCKGPGSNTSKRVKWEKKLEGSDLTKFSKQEFIDKDGWIATQP